MASTSYDHYQHNIAALYCILLWYCTAARLSYYIDNFNCAVLCCAVVCYSILYYTLQHTTLLYPTLPYCAAKL